MGISRKQTNPFTIKDDYFNNNNNNETPENPQELQNSSNSSEENLNNNNNINNQNSTGRKRENSSFSNLTNLTNNTVNTNNSASQNELVLNFIKSSEDLRNTYLTKLIQNKIWNPTEKKSIHNSLIIFDWDDTLLCTSFLTPHGIFREDIKISDENSQKIKKLDDLVFQILSIALENSDTYIITNAQKGWVEFSAEKFYPRTFSILHRIKIISARENYEKILPGNSRQWKIKTFLKIAEIFDKNLITNLICLGDSYIEMDAAQYLYSKFSKAYIKTLKFKENPNLDDLIKQITLIIEKFLFIISSIKNLTIRVERKLRRK